MDIVTVIDTIVNATASGASSEVDTIGSRDHRTGAARLFLNITSLAGTSPTVDLDIVAVLDGVDIVLASFTQATGATTESTVITVCPGRIKAVYTLGGTVTDFDAVITAIRL